GLQNTCGFNAQLSRGTGRIGVMHFGVESATLILDYLRRGSLLQHLLKGRGGETHKRGNDRGAPLPVT
ncbi:MAG: hypothetical protein AB2807_10355, partial [Candidatus Sedimenticola endophacoides]